MIPLSRDLLEPLIARARLAPSVHNIQPSRWRINGDRLQLLGDPARAIPVADPDARDWRLSHGAHFEGLSLALATKGAKIVGLTVGAADERPASDGLVPVARCAIEASSSKPGKTEPVADRVSWRGTFKATDTGTIRDLASLASERPDCLLVTERSAVASIAGLADRAALYFLRNEQHRAELLQWLRLSKSLPNYDLDGLNADAMLLSPIEAWGAGLVLGPLFRPLDRIGLAGPVVAETKKTASAAAIALFHRPAEEDPFISGREFYRTWLAFERHGLKGCPMSVLADWSVSRGELAKRFKVPAGRHIVSVFRIGRPAGTPATAHARLPVDALFV